jgi:hypothetical protein
MIIKSYSNNRLKLLLLIGVISISCGHHDVNLTTSENPLIVGKTEKLEGSLCPTDIQTIDSLIIIREYGDSYFFHIYNKNSLKLIGKFGREGRGPFEYHIPKMMTQNIKIRDSVFLLVYDDTRKRIDFINILEAINKTNYYPISISFKNKKIAESEIINSAVMTVDSFIVGNANINGINAEKEGRFFCYDIYNDNMTWEPFYPIPKIEPSERAKGDLYTSRLALRPNGIDIAATSLFFKRIDILDKKGKLERSIIFNQNKEPDFSNADSWPPKGSHEYFTSISVSQDFIYALDIDIDVDNREIIDTVSLIKTSWEDKDGTPEIFKLTPRVLKIAVDEENKKVYGIQMCSSNIYIYDLK